MARDKVIQVQKKAQSLEQFQRAAAGEGAPMLKSVLIGAGVVVGGIIAWGAWSVHRQRAAEAFETQVATLRLQVEGDGITPLPADQLQTRMQTALPRLEALVKEAPSSRRAQAAGLLATWKLDLSGQGGLVAATDTPWGRLREAQRLLALGDGKASKALLEPLRAKATADEAWGQAYWVSLLEVDRLNGDRDQAIRDLGEFRTRFKDAGSLPQLDRMIQSI